ncbi:uncharacterized protein LOC141695410 [Apium graveolens]|uniref:uncharacterized protein LOC141695410 n=1 Tax=Apium graveolens TaxID=4045 RepID=UPI003D7B1F3A
MEGWISKPCSGYNQIKLDKIDIPKVSFISDFGVFCYLVMEFGLKNAGATYQSRSDGLKEDASLLKRWFYPGQATKAGDLQAHKIEVLMNQPLRNIIQSPKASSRLIKWAIELGEFDIKYKPRMKIKSQSLADFMVECTIPNQEVGGQRDTEAQGMEEKEDNEGRQNNNKEFLVPYFDGASKANSSGAGLVLQSLDGFLIEYDMKLDFPTTNNEAKYEALIAGLGLAGTLKVKNLKVCGDLKLVVSLVKREEENAKADVLSKFASSEIEESSGSMYFRVLKTRSIDVKLISPIGLEGSWIDPIKAHLQTGWLSSDVVEARKLSLHALRYSLIDGILYKRSFIVPYLGCLRPDEAQLSLDEVYEGICGQHLGGRALAHKITRLGFYWPEMMAGSKGYVKRCDRCQKHAPVVRQPPEMLTSINSPIPLAIWGMDFSGLPNGHCSKEVLDCSN